MSDRGDRKGRLVRAPLDPILEKLPSAAYLCDAQGFVTYCNPRATELWGSAPVLAPARDHVVTARALRDRCEVLGEEIVVERANGERIHPLASPSPIFDEAGELPGALPRPGHDSHPRAAPHRQ